MHVAVEPNTLYWLSLMTTYLCHICYVMYFVLYIYIYIYISMLSKIGLSFLLYVCIFHNDIVLILLLTIETTAV